MHVFVYFLLFEFDFGLILFFGAIHFLKHYQNKKFLSESSNFVQNQCFEPKFPQPLIRPGDVLCLLDILLIMHLLSDTPRDFMH